MLAFPGLKKGEVVGLVIILALAGWALVELVLWLLSFVKIVI